MRIPRLIGIFLFMILVSGCVSKVETEVKNEGNSKEVTSKKIIATTHAITEIMDQLEIDLIGVPTTTYEVPERYKDITPVGNPMQPDMEIIRSLNPDEVLSVTTLEYDLKASFEQAGVSTSFLNLQSVDNMITTIRELGKQYDRIVQAEAITSSIEQKLTDIQEQTKNSKNPKVLILFGIPGSYLIATEHSYVGSLVETAGGTNVLTGQTEEYISANTEYLQQADADIILRLSHGVPDQVVDMFNKEFETNEIWKHFKAVKNKQVYDLKEPVFATTANLHITEALDELVDILHKQ